MSHLPTSNIPSRAYKQERLRCTRIFNELRLTLGFYSIRTSGLLSVVGDPDLEVVDDLIGDIRACARAEADAGVGVIWMEEG